MCSEYTKAHILNEEIRRKIVLSLHYEVLVTENRGELKRKVKKVEIETKASLGPNTRMMNVITVQKGTY